MNGFEWQGMRSDAMGVHVSSFAPIPKAKERVERIEIPGRSGKLTVSEGDDIYEDIELEIDLWIERDSDESKVMRWLRGSGKLRLDTRPGGYYNARVIEAYSFEKITPRAPQRTLKVTFTASPFFMIDASSIGIGYSGTVNNIYGYASLPVLRVSGSGSITVTVNGVSVLFSGVYGSAALDCEAKMITSGSATVTLEDDEWPVLKSGSNSVTCSGGSLTIDPRWRCL